VLAEPGRQTGDLFQPWVRERGLDAAPAHPTGPNALDAHPLLELTL
jgi:hypothetical protein